MRLIILDAGYTGGTGHHQTVNTLLARAAAARGVETLVLSHLDLPIKLVPPFAVERCLRCNPYRGAQSPELSGAELFAAQNATMAADLAAHLPASRLRAGDVIVAHTVMPEQLVGILRWYEQLDRPDLPLRFMLLFPPGFARPDGRHIDEALAGDALAQWGRSSADVRFYSDTQELSGFYQNLSGLRFTTTPVAIDFAGRAPVARPQATGRPLTWVFAGDARPEKGMILLLSAWRRYSRRHPGDRLITQVAHAEPHARQLVDKLKQVTILEGALHEQSYLEHLSAGDCILLPYHPGRYRMRTSHILLEALGMGRPVIVGPHPWMEAQVEAFAAPVGIAMRRWNIESLDESMEAFAANAESLLNNAMTSAAAVRATHSPDRLLDSFLEGT